MKTMTLELPDEIYEVVERTAQASSQPVASWVAERVPLLLPARKAPPVLTSEEREVAMARLSRHFGRVNSGGSDAANNERIDADLMREYNNNHEDE